MTKKKISGESSIEWCNYTWNPWQGCAKITDGCKNCYMFRDKRQYGQEPTKVVRSKSPTFNKPYKWNEPSLVFTCSWSDFFIEDADEWRDEAWEIIRNTPHLTYQILTKRPERILDNLPDDWGDGYSNVWLGVSIENSATKHRLNTLANVPAKLRFISAEPLIERIDLSNEFDILTNKYSWLIIGAESGNDNGLSKYRPCELEWLEYLVEIGFETDTAPFVKQLGTHLSKKLELRDRHARNIDEFPENLKFREYPK